MATTKTTFVVLKNASLVGTAQKAAGSVVGYDKTSATTLVNQGAATQIDRQFSDFATSAYASSGAFSLALASGTPVTIDFTAIASTATSQAGDNTFATVNELIFVNTGAADIIVSVGSSNPFRLPLAGTTPTITVAAGSVLHLQSLAGYAVDSTHKTIKFDPGASVASIAVGVAGA